MTFPQALKMLSCNFGPLTAVPAWVPGPFVPESVTRAREAVREFTASILLFTSCSVALIRCVGIYERNDREPEGREKARQN
jgi:hypothetical protein